MARAPPCSTASPTAPSRSSRWPRLGTCRSSLPARKIPHYLGSRHTPGDYWSAPTGRLIGYESWLESKWTTLVDFDLDITAFVGQPLTFDGVDADGPWQHTDLFARRADGSVLLLDVKNPEKLATSTFGTSPPHLCSLRRVGLALQPGGPTGRPVVPTPRALERASGDVQCVYVVPDHRAAGLGGRLIDAVVNLAHELGLERLTVHSGARAISAYSRHGFAVSPRLLQAEFTQESR